MGKSSTVKILKNREFESLRPRILREIAEKKPRVRENREFGTASLRGISVSVCLPESFFSSIILCHRLLRYCVILLESVVQQSLLSTASHTFLFVAKNMNDCQYSTILLQTQHSVDYDRAEIQFLYESEIPGNSTYLHF